MPRTFIRNILIFAIPVLLLAGIPLLVGLQTGDLVPMPVMIDTQQHDPTLLYHPYHTADSNSCYRYRTAITRQANIMVMGASWVQHYRANFFKNHDDFYNAYVPSMNLQQQVALYEGITAQYQPDMMIFHFIPGFIDSPYQDTAPVFSDAYCNDVEITRLRSAYQSIFVNPIAGLEVLQTLQKMRDETTDWQLSGSRIAARKTGIAFDGSFRLLDDTVGQGDIDFEALLSQDTFINSGYALYPSQSIRDLELALLSRLIDHAKAHDITLITVMPPIREDLYQYLLYFAGTDAHIRAIESLFADADMPLFNFLNDDVLLPRQNVDFRNYSHGGERLTLRWHLALAKQYPVIFADYVDIPALETILETSNDSFQIFAP